MIQDVHTRKGLPAITSDQWHVVHSVLAHPGTKHPFVRGVESEHPDRASCWRAARDLRLHIAASSVGVPEADRGEVFVRRPNFKSLKVARTLRGRRVRSGRTGSGTTAVCGLPRSDAGAAVGAALEQPHCSDHAVEPGI